MNYNLNIKNFENLIRHRARPEPPKATHPYKVTIRGRKEAQMKEVIKKVLGLIGLLFEFISLIL